MVTKEQVNKYKELLNENKKISKKVMKKFKRTYIISVIIGAILGFGIVAAGIVLELNGIMSFDLYMNYFMKGFALFVLFFIIHIIIHEAGHLIFGLVSGYGFLSFRIFSFTLVKKDGKFHRKRFKIGGTVGQCLMYPPERNEDGSFPYVLYNLGGGLTNLITSLPFIIAGIFVDSITGRVLSISFAASGIMLAANNLIPINFGLQNDGMNLLSLSKDKCFQDGFYLQLQINAEMSDGKLITEYDIKTFDLPEDADDTNMLTVANRFYSYYWYLAQEDYESAYNILMKMTKKLGEYSLVNFNMIQAERLFFMVLHKRPLEEIAALYSSTRQVLISSKTNIGIQRIRYVYEILLTEDDKKDIMSLIRNKEVKKWKPTDLDKLYKEIIKTAERYPVEGEAKMHIDIMNYCVFSSQDMVQ